MALAPPRPSAAPARTAADDLAGRPVARFRVDAGSRRGALTASDGETIASAARRALALRVPLVGVFSSGGCDVSEGVASLHAWGQAARAVVACSGVVPVAVAVTGPALSGSSLLLGLADLVVMTRPARAFMSGPRMVAAITGQRLDAEALGGPAVHARETGVADLLADDEDDAVRLIAEALAHLPDSTDDDPPLLPTADPPERRAPGLGRLLPAAATGSYDVRRVVETVVDDGALFELRPRFAPNLVTGLATVGGRPVGVLANQPQSIAGTLDIPASRKGARFVSFCDAFNLPLLTFVDTPGFFPGKDLEWRGMIRHGAELAFAYAAATVPRVCVLLRKAYGGAYIVMDSHTLGNDVCLAWPTAEVAVMGARGAVSILHRGADAAELERLVAAYEEAHLTPWTAAERGYVDAVIDPADTRPMVARALELLASKRERLVRRKHSNTPL